MQPRQRSPSSKGSAPAPAWYPEDVVEYCGDYIINWNQEKNSKIHSTKEFPWCGRVPRPGEPPPAGLQCLRETKDQVTLHHQTLQNVTHDLSCAKKVSVRSFTVLHKVSRFMLYVTVCHFTASCTWHLADTLMTLWWQPLSIPQGGTLCFASLVRTRQITVGSLSSNLASLSRPLRTVQGAVSPTSRWRNETFQDGLILFLLRLPEAFEVLCLVLGGGEEEL